MEPLGGTLRLRAPAFRQFELLTAAEAEAAMRKAKDGNVQYRAPNV